MAIQRSLAAVCSPLRVLLVLLALMQAVIAQAEDNPTLRDIVEAEARSEELIKEAAARGDVAHMDRSTPRALVIFVGAALEEGDYQRAAEAMDLRYLPKGITKEDGPELVKQLRYIFDRHIWIDVGLLSDKPEGDLKDGLPSYREAFGTLETRDGPVDLYLQRVPDGEGGREWKIAGATVALIPRLWAEFGHSEVAGELSSRLPVFEWLGVDNWQWAYLLAFIIVLTAMVAAFNWMLKRWAVPDGHIEGLRRLLTGPLGIFIYITIVRLFMLELGLSIKARAIFESVMLVYLANIFLVLGIIDLLARRSRRRMERSGTPEAQVIIRPIATGIKMIAVALLLVMGLDNAGYDVTTIIAGLGVSSIAVALAAQKTLENLIGALTLYIARPIKPGEFCRFGDKLGTVEEIGLRSTLLRTPDRTIVNIPNGMLAEAVLENYSKRDKIRFFRMIGVRLATTPDQLRYVLASLRELLYAHPSILTDSVSVRLSDINDYAFMVRVDSRADTNDFQQYLAIAEDVNLRIVDLIHEAGTNFALPSQTIMLEDPSLPDGEQQQRIETLVEQWRKEDRLPFPQWSDEYIRGVENTLEFPPQGSFNRPRSREPGDEDDR